MEIIPTTDLREIFAGEWEALTTDEIAQELYISPNTVKVHCKNVYAKLKLRSKSDFVRYANDNKLFE
jgi:LuxR family maltose regulon positive regulatory protein